MEAIEMREENNTATGIEMRNSVLDRDKLQVNKIQSEKLNFVHLSTGQEKIQGSWSKEEWKKEF